MIFSSSQRPVFPLLPPYGEQDPKDGQIAPSHADGLTPYLGLRSRLSQLWLNRWTMLLLLILIRILIAVTGINTSMGSAKSEALSACTALESMGSSMASMPYYLAEGINELTANTVQSQVNTIRSLLLFSITGIKKLILLIVAALYGIVQCLLTMALETEVHMITTILEGVLDGLNTTLNGITSALEKTATSFESKLEGLAEKVNHASELLGIEFPTLDLNGTLDDLKDLNFSIPSSVNDKLEKFNSTDVNIKSQLKKVDDFILSPFDDLEKMLNARLKNYTFDKSALKTPEKVKLNFCDEDTGINDFFNDIGDLISKTKKIFIAVLIVAAVLLIVGMVWNEIRRWRLMNERSQLMRMDTHHDPMDIVYIVSRPDSAAAGIKAASWFSNSRRQILVRWVIAYATSPGALFILALALAALFACLCQYILLKSVSKTLPTLNAKLGVNNFADKVVYALQNASDEWADSGNKAIGDLEDDLNNNLFHWINVTATGINSTIGEFRNFTNKAISEPFSWIPYIYDKLQGIADCFLEPLVTAQNFSTWVSKEAHVQFILLPNDTFSLGARDSISDGSSPSQSFLADQGDETSNKVTEVVQSAFNKLFDALRIEAIIATCLLMIWVIIFLIGVIRALTLWWGRDRNRGEGGGHAMDVIPNHPAPAPDSSGAGFSDVPLTAIPKGTLGSVQAMPQYETPAESSAARGGSEFRDEKMGFAGQRNYQLDSSSMRQSSYVDYDVKRS